MTTLLTLVTLSGAGCGDDDTITPGGGDSGGRAGSGSGGGGGGGRAGTGGGGSGGTGGVAGTGGGGSGGSSGTGGSGGSSGSTNDRDGGVEPDGGDGGPQLSAREQIFTAYCAKLDEVDGCEPPDDCVQTNIDGLYTTFLETEPGYDACIDEADAYFQCASTAPVSEFECADGAPQYIIGGATCEDEQTAFNDGLGDPSSCAD